MPRKVSSAEVSQAISLMEQGVGQRELERQTNLSRPYLRKIAKQVGHIFPRNGVEILGTLCMCANCGIIFRKSPSKVERAKRQFCDEYCRSVFFKGSLHPNWSHGKTASTFSEWVKSQAQYKEFVEKVLERDGHMCVISRRTDNLQVHHILMKNETSHPEKVFDTNNALTLNFDIHVEIHKLIREGVSFDSCIAQLKEKYQNEDGICNQETSGSK